MKEKSIFVCLCMALILVGVYSFAKMTNGDSEKTEQLDVNKNEKSSAGAVLPLKVTEKVVLSDDTQPEIESETTLAQSSESLIEFNGLAYTLKDYEVAKRTIEVLSQTNFANIPEVSEQLFSINDRNADKQLTFSEVQLIPVVAQDRIMQNNYDEITREYTEESQAKIQREQERQRLEFDIKDYQNLAPQLSESTNEDRSSDYTGDFEALMERELGHIKIAVSDIQETLYSIFEKVDHDQNGNLNEIEMSSFKQRLGIYPQLVVAAEEERLKSIEN